MMDGEEGMMGDAVGGAEVSQGGAASAGRSGRAPVRAAILNRRRMLGRDGEPVTNARLLPDQDPMPEAWDETPYSGPPIRSPRPSMRILEGYLDGGDLDGAEKWLRDESLHMEELRRRDIPSWNARHALAQARYDLMRAYEAVHGAGCMREEAHRRALSRAWHPFGAGAGATGADA